MTKRAAYAGKGRDVLMRIVGREFVTVTKRAAYAGKGRDVLMRVVGREPSR